MNKNQGMMSGGAELQDSYPSAAYEALKKRKMSLRDSLTRRAASVKNANVNSSEMAKPQKSLRPKRIGV